MQATHPTFELMFQGHLLIIAYRKAFQNKQHNLIERVWIKIYGQLS